TAIVRATTLPPLLGAPVALVETDEDPFSGPARRFCSHTPFLPVRHPKRRGDRLRDAVEEQVATELVRRGLPSPARVSRLPGPWETFRIVRLAKKGCFPELGAHGFDIDLPEPVQGPIAIGRNSHFGMGLFLPTT
ncbi:MAG: type I-U CRISPR-associated protein Cas5/Cas6, partial [Thermoleophilia bacterium]